MAIIRRISRNIHLHSDRTHCAFTELNENWLRKNAEKSTYGPQIHLLDQNDYKKEVMTFHQRIDQQPYGKGEVADGFQVYTKEAMTEIVKNEFISHLEDQATFVERINSNFDEVLERTFMSALYNDLIYPFWFKMPKLEGKTLYKMSYWYRLKYLLSIKEIVPLAQMGDDDIGISDDAIVQHEVVPDPTLHWCGSNDPLLIIKFEAEADKFYQRFPVEQYKLFLEIHGEDHNYNFAIIDRKLYFLYYGDIWYDMDGLRHKMEVFRDYTFPSCVAQHLYLQKSLDLLEISQDESLCQELEGLNINTPEIPIPIGLEIIKDTYASLTQQMLCSWKWCRKTGNTFACSKGMPFKEAVMCKVKIFAEWIKCDYLTQNPTALTLFVYLFFTKDFIRLDNIHIKDRHILCTAFFKDYPILLGFNASDVDQYLPSVDPLIPFFRMTLDGFRIYSNQPLEFTYDEFVVNYEQTCYHLRSLLEGSVPKYEDKTLKQKF
jgi:hypothetical protein